MTIFLNSWDSRNFHAMKSQFLDPKSHISLWKMANSSTSPRKSNFQTVLEIFRIHDIPRNFRAFKVSLEDPTSSWRRRKFLWKSSIPGKTLRYQGKFKGCTEIWGGLKNFSRTWKGEAERPASWIKILQGSQKIQVFSRVFKVLKVSRSCGHPVGGANCYCYTVAFPK